MPCQRATHDSSGFIIATRPSKLGDVTSKTISRSFGDSRNGTFSFPSRTHCRRAHGGCERGCVCAVARARRGARLLLRLYEPGDHARAQPPVPVRHDRSRLVRHLVERARRGTLEKRKPACVRFRARGCDVNILALGPPRVGGCQWLRPANFLTGEHNRHMLRPTSGMVVVLSLVLLYVTQQHQQIAGAASRAQVTTAPKRAVVAGHRHASRLHTTAGAHDFARARGRAARERGAART